MIGIYLLTKRYVNGKRKIRSCWRRPWIARHDEQGAYYNLIRELEVDNDLHKYLRITKVRFDDIVGSLPESLLSYNGPTQIFEQPSHRANGWLSPYDFSPQDNLWMYITLK